jgi:hypothetical protein
MIRPFALRAALVALTALWMVACAGNHTTPDGAVAALTSVAPPLSLTDAQTPRVGTVYSNLYVANGGANTVTIYKPNSKSVFRTISKGMHSPSSMALDDTGKLYVLNCFGCYSKEGFVTIYKALTGKLLQTIPSLATPTAIATDSNGHLFVADFTDNAVDIFDSKSSKPVRVITQGVFAPDALAVDSKNNVYVANCGPVCLKGHTGSVTVYDAGKLTVSRTISQGIVDPNRLLVDRKDDLYVLNYGNGDFSNFIASVAVFAPGKNVPYEQYDQDLAGPGAIAVSASSSLFVTNCAYFCEYGSYTGWVTAYADGKTASPRKISQGVSTPTALAVGPSSYLFVANSYLNNVQVYAPGSGSVFRTISEGVSYPNALLFGP